MHNTSRMVADDYHYKFAYDTMHQINALLIAVEHSGMAMDSGDVLAAIGGIQELARKMSESLDKVGDMEVHHG